MAGASLVCEQERKQTISTQHALAGYRLQNTATHSSFNTSPICFMDMPMELPTAVQSILTRQKEAGRCFVFVYMETGQVLASTPRSFNRMPCINNMPLET